MAEQDAKEVKVPALLLAVGFGLLMLAAMRLARGNVTMGDVAGALMVAVAIEVVLMLVGAFVTAYLIGVAFGAPGPAILKLAAIVTFPAGLAYLVNIPGLSWVINLVLYLVLLVYLFDLDLKEALIFAGVMIVIRLIVNFMGLAANL